MPVPEPPPPPVDIQSSCDHVAWHNAPNTSFDDVTGYEIRLVNSAKDKEVVTHLDASATFYNLDKLSETLKNELTSVQVYNCSVIKFFFIHYNVLATYMHVGSCCFK